MAIIDTITGYYGFTVVGNNDTPDNNGHVKKCLIAIVYPLQVNDVDIEISRGIDDWAVKMGNGDIIPLSNPNVIFINRDNAIVEFDMSTGYPSNSPCTLVYHSDTASFNVKPRTVTRPFEPNSVSGQFAFTVEGYGGTPGGNGLVNRLIASIPYPQMINTVKFEISKDPAHWGARMADGSLITLRDPEVMSTNVDNAVVKFTMDEYYPSNSPCVLVYRHKDASITIKPADDDTNFYPIADIIDVPSKGISGTTLDLNECHVMPFNASSQKIDWSIVDGPGEIINKHYLFLKQGGVVNIRATVENGSGDGVPFLKTFSVNVTQNVITILGQPIEEINAFVNKINHTISVTAKSLTEEIKYQWYSNIKNSYDGASKIIDKNDSSFEIPQNLTKGNYYYFCELISNGSYNVKTSICHVYIDNECVGIRIMPRLTKMPLETTRQLHIEQTPSDSDLPDVKWRSSNSDVISVDDNGNIKSTTLSNTSVIISAETIYGNNVDSMEITTEEFHSVVDISGIDEYCNPEMPYQLYGTVQPHDATNKDILWEVIDAGITGALIKNDNIFYAYNVGDCKIRATITNGTSLHQDYHKEFLIKVKKGFVAVKDITLSVDTNISYNTGTKLSLNANITPATSSATDIVWTVMGNNHVASILGNVLSLNAPGSVTIRATIKHGRSDNEDFYKEFRFNVIQSSFVAVNMINVIENDSIKTIDGKLSYDPNIDSCSPVDFELSIDPINATNSDIEVTVEDQSEALLTYDQINHRISCDIGFIDPSRENFRKEFSALLKLKITNGIANGVDYERLLYLNIIPPPAPVKIIPVENIDIMFPEPLRCMYPVLVNRSSINPIDATAAEDGIYWDRERLGAAEGADTVLYKPSEFDLPCTLIDTYTFDWNNNETYLFPWTPGKINLVATVYNGSLADPTDEYCQETVDYIQKWELEFLPPWIPVMDVLNIPEEIPCNQDIILCGELDTKGGYDFYNVYWDDETPSHTDLQFRMGPSYIDEQLHPNTANAILSGNNVIRANKPGQFTIQAYVKDGKLEPIRWYYKDYAGEAYTKLFTITVTEEEKSFSSPVLTLKLDDYSYVSMYKVGEMSKLCNDLPSDSPITIGDRTFRKDQILEIKFWDETMETPPNITSLRNFGRNCINLQKLDRIPNTVNGENCLRNFLQGCKSFNDNIIIPNTITGKYCMKYFMKDCNRFNRPIVIPKTVTGDGCLHGFMYGCRSFNSSITIPRNVSGARCMERFMMKCSSFNQPINLPNNVSGRACMRDFMSECESFNRDITLPNDLTSQLEICSMMKNCKSMCSSITVSEDYGNHIAPSTDEIGTVVHVNEQTLSCVYNDCDMIHNGIKIVGPGSDKFIDQLMNSEIIPYRNIIKG